MKPGRPVVLISGGSRGLGEAIVTHFLTQDHIVATFSRSKTPFIEACQRNDLQAHNFIWEEIDATDTERVRQFVLMIARQYGRIDILLNNAGGVAEGVLALIPTVDIHRIIALNLETAIHLAQICSRVMLSQQDGVIINISSIMGLRGYAGLSVYSATKAAIDGLTRSLARELGPRGIRVNSIAPGYFETSMSSSLSIEQRAQIIRHTPLGRLGTVEDVVGVIQFLVSPSAQYITGQTLVVDGGMTC